MEFGITTSERGGANGLHFRGVWCDLIGDLQVAWERGL